MPSKFRNSTVRSRISDGFQNVALFDGGRIFRGKIAKSWRCQRSWFSLCFFVLSPGLSSPLLKMNWHSLSKNMNGAKTSDLGSCTRVLVVLQKWQSLRLFFSVSFLSYFSFQDRKGTIFTSKNYFTTRHLGRIAQWFWRRRKEGKNLTGFAIITTISTVPPTIITQFLLPNLQNGSVAKTSLFLFLRVQLQKLFCYKARKGGICSLFLYHLH